MLRQGTKDGAQGQSLLLRRRFGPAGPQTRANSEARASPEAHANSPARPESFGAENLYLQ
jgi:hypothetical protein